MYGDIILLNKTDLVAKTKITEIEYINCGNTPNSSLALNCI